MTGFQRIDLGLTDANAACSCCGADGSHASAASAEAASGAAAPGATAPGAAAPGATATEGALTAEYLVDGMTCSHCVSSVTEELSDVAGVQRVAVDLRPGAASVVTVTGSGPISDDAVRAAVEEAGYTLAAPGA